MNFSPSKLASDHALAVSFSSPTELASQGIELERSENNSFLTLLKYFGASCLHRLKYFASLLGVVWLLAAPHLTRRSVCSSFPSPPHPTRLCCAAPRSSAPWTACLDLPRPPARPVWLPCASGTPEPPLHGSAGFSLCCSSSAGTGVASWVLWAPFLLLRPCPSISEPCFCCEKAQDDLSMTCSALPVPTRGGLPRFSAPVREPVCSKWSPLPVHAGLATWGLDRREQAQPVQPRPCAQTDGFQQ